MEHTFCMEQTFIHPFYVLNNVLIPGDGNINKIYYFSAKLQNLGEPK